MKTTSVERLTGTVKWFAGNKGYGFIQRDDGGEDLFVHYSELEGKGFRNLEEGQRVEMGQRIGMIRFGSQVDTIVPDSPGLRVNVRAGDRVTAGVTVIAEIDKGRSSADGDGEAKGGEDT